jgi:purine-nucleoside phosphorylase
LADWAGKRVLIFEGRSHYYEGHPWRSITESVRISHFLGARVLLLTNAAGGIHDDLRPGCLMGIRAHIEWTGPDSWRQLASNDPPPSPYSPRLLDQLGAAASEAGLSCHPGSYAAVTGPCYETPAEIRALRILGADAVGMSTAREVQAGFELGMACAAVSCITNRAAGLAAGPIKHEEVLASAKTQQHALAKLLEGFLRRF